MTNRAAPHRAASAEAQVIDRKYVQKVKAAHEQRERSLARMVITALATCGTLVGWMLFAKPATSANQPTVDAPSVPVATTEPLPPTAVVLSVAVVPIPTVMPLPTFAPLPTLVAVDNLVGVPEVTAPNAPDQAIPQVPMVAPDAMPALRVVTMPVMPARPGRPNPSAPNPGGNTGGSK